MINIKGVYFSYVKDRLILNDVNLSIKKGEIVSLLGPNGSGKTTLLKCINGMLIPERGNIFFEGKNILKMKREEIAKNICYVPQEHKAVFPYTVLDVVLLGRIPYLGIFSTPGEGDIKKCIEILKLIGTENLADRSYTQLSGGERKLCLIARALSQDAECILCDEPTAHLDLKHSTEILNVIKELNKKKKLTAIIIIHDPNLAVVVDRVILLKNGKLFADGTPQEIITEKNIRDAYECEVCCISKDRTNFIHPKIRE